VSYKEGDWYIFCDICGQRTLASQSSRLSTYTGRGELIVCRHDVDTIDQGLTPFRPLIEKNIPYTRINHTDTSESVPSVDLETMTTLYYLLASQDSAILLCSQDDEPIIVQEPI
jgi:hypothetical protein